MPVARVSLSICLLLLTAAGCGPSEPDFAFISNDEWREVLQDYRGSPVVVNVWASWCRTCMDLFPHFVDAYRRHDSGDIEFASICLDELDDQPAVDRARRTLIEQQATFPHYLLKGDISETFWKLDLEGIPAVLGYDQEGRLRFRLHGDPIDNRISPADLEDAIESLEQTISATGPAPGDTCLAFARFRRN